MAATHALPPAAPVQRPRVLLVGAGFAAAASVMVFVGLLAVYLAERTDALAAGDTWLPREITIPLQQPTTIFFTLAMSVVTMQWAVSAVAKDDRINSYLALGVTFLFGFSAIVMTTYLWTLMGADVTANLQSVLIYTITGGHLLMVVIALVFVALMAFRALAGGFNSRQHDGITAAAIYWYAMVAVYALIWITIYVTK
jgi:heme/copper-type cytochrome/quinol oxidase subunit 3